MTDQFSRSRLLFGQQGMERLFNARVAVFGLGGVGGYVVEALARSGVGELHLIDRDVVTLTNLNRQILALHSTLGRYKCDAARERALDINPNARVFAYRTFYTPETAGEFDFTKFDYIVDAIDTVTGKLTLIEEARRAHVPIISSMGAGNKTDASALRVGDIYKTSMDPLARIMRKELKKRGIRHLKVVWSQEEPVKRAPGAALEVETPERGRRDTPGSCAFVPAAAGLIIAGEVVRDLTLGEAGSGENG